ncbi:MAG: hypothetical protein ACI85O_003384 [Saprospiraceae bacterium]|jgi:hypothetical protein
MKRIIVNLFFLVFLLASCKGQDYTAPKIEHINNSLEDVIIYYFPERVNNILEEYLVSNRDSIVESLIVLNQKGEDLIELSWLHWSKKIPQDQLTELAELSNRIIKIKDMEIPIIFTTDLRYSRVGFSMSFKSFQLSFKAHSWSSECEIIKVSTNIAPAVQDKND